MTQQGETDAADRERRLDEAIAAYLAAEDAGNSPPRDEFVARDPELSDGLRSFFRGHDRLGRLAEPLRVAGRPVAETASQAAVTSDLETTIDTPSGDPIEPRANALVPGIRIRYFGDYELLSEIGRGGMGVVYKARQVSLNRLVALKMIRSAALRHGRRAAAVPERGRGGRHARPPHIVPIFEVGEHEGQRYFSMKLIDGGEPGQASWPITPPIPRRRRGWSPTGRRGGAPRPPAGHPAPRPQAGQHPARRARPAARHRLRPGQAGRGRQRADQSGAIMGTPGLHGARAGVGPQRGGDDGDATSTAWGRSSTPC